jgi:hypothetical protein
MEHSTITNSPPMSDGQQTDGSGASDAHDRAREAAGQAQEKAQQAGDRIREQLSGRFTQAGEQVTTAASDIRSVADELRKQGKDQPAKIAEQAAERAERVGGYLRESDADRMLHDIEHLGRRRPWAVGVGGALLGLVASRFLKASSTQRYHRMPQFEGRESGPGRASGIETVPGRARIADPAPGSGL